MHVLVLLLLIVGCWGSGNIDVLVDGKGGYNITINNRVWLRSSRTAIYVDNKWYSSDDNSLPLTGISHGSGFDPYLGNYTDIQLTYDLVRGGIHTDIVGHIRNWYSSSAISFQLETGNQTLINTVPLNMDHVRTIFPSFHVEEIDQNDERGYFTFEGEMVGNNKKHAGRWNSRSKVIKSGGMESGPMVLFNLTQKGEGDILVLSPFSRFMATSLSQTNRNILDYGIIGSMLSIPVNYNHSMIISYSSNGINQGIREWGQIMQKAYNRTSQHRVNDLTINYLGYYTDNGAYYYYKTEKGMNYEETIVNIRHQIPLPFHYIQLDSWWYYKGMDDGVSQWTARPDIFPDGLQALYRRLENISIAAHNRYWSYDTIYKQNYSFALDKNNKKALPIGNDSFWIDLFTEANKWGLVLYEQDWLDRQTIDFLPTRTDIHLGHQWLMSMGEAADKVGINIQYCMSLPRHILTALQIPRVTHARTSVDYAFHIESWFEHQWAIGISSMFADALGLAPFKDIFWSSKLEPGAPYVGFPREILPEREMAIATLSTGPVAPGDGIKYTNVEHIMKCCRQDGLILKPERPLTMINRLISDWAFYDDILQGQLYSTRTTINGQTFHVIFASNMKRDYLVYPSMIGAQSGVIWSHDNSSVVLDFNDTNPLHVSANKCHDLSMCLWYVSPRIQLTSDVSYALLGEWNKWTAISHQRIIEIDNQSINHIAIINIIGAPNETVSLVIYHSKLLFITVNCKILPDIGEVRITITTNDIDCN
ncbi:unnamed protein product [Adineta steineri]|uniref:Uncharacterized protein n=1 Tax=Adineta steineri TaxID=433720 RepID=A0A814WUX3_9BILA|nr:unnamed protein product [Adineta steineri]CAF1476883.1 unnamed protein product [Adineta steineri]